MEITAPHLLAKVPRTTKPDAATSFGNVYTVRDGQKKRRKEICVAVDGDSLSLYEVQDGRILASHPVPPSSTFSGPPCSIRSSVAGKPHRTTYCTIKRGDLYLQSFETSEDQHVTTTSTGAKLPDQQSPVVYLDFIPTPTGGQVLVVQRNGSFTLLSDDLKSTLLARSLTPADQQEGMHILAVQYLSSSEAQKSILRQRADLVAEAAQRTSYLAVVYERQDDKKLVYGVFATGDSTQTGALGAVSVRMLFEHILDLEVHEPSSVGAREISCSFSPSGSHLYIRYAASFFSYDLSRLVPVETACLHTGVLGSHEIMAISPAFAICSFQDSLRLYDLKHQSVQASIDTRKANLKRKRIRMASEFQSGPVEFVTYFANSARIIGRRRHQLLAIDVNLGGFSKRMLERGSKLIHNIGRGIGDLDTPPGPNIDLHIAIGTPEVNAASDTEWQQVRRRLDQLAQAGDVAGFEDAYVDNVRRDLLKVAVPAKTVDGLPSTRTAIPDYKIQYLLSKLFQVDHNMSAVGDDATGAKSLKVQIPSFRLLIWLSHLGLLSSRSVESALAVNDGAAESILVDAVARALLTADPEKNLIVDCLTSGFSPYVEEQAATVQILIDQALASFSEAGAAEKDPGEKFKLAADVEVQRLSTSKSDGTWLPSQLQRALVLALDRFGTAPNSRISKCLRSLFTQTEVLALVQFLRQQLFQGGHTRSYQSQANIVSGEQQGTSTVELDAVVRILSSCIDAIGPLGFYGGMDHEDFVGNIVPDLVTEITHAQQSLEDVTELQGMLREVLRYQESLQKCRDAGARISNNRLRAGSEQPLGTIVTLYSEATEGPDGLRNGDGLPLSLRAEHIVKPIKIRKGGGQVSKRSAREMNMLERRQKGQYSFERLVL